MLSQAGDAELAGLQSLNNLNLDSSYKIRKKKEADKRYHDLLHLLTETQIKLQDFIDDIDLKLIQARQDLQHHKDMLAEHIALEDCLHVLDNDGLLERNADGTLKDKNLERAVTRYLKDNHMNTDLSDDARIYAVAQNLLPTYPTQDQLLDVISLDKEIITTLEDGKDQAQTLQAKLNDPDIAKREVKQISKQADKVATNTTLATANLIIERDNLLDTEHETQNNQQGLFNISVTNYEPQNLSTEVKELPATNLKF